ncbi:MAG: patatin-like phospholipase family protein [Anaerolineales bacterium]|nr:patatin-like phospholipase family protein [Anaerolineales bacterium]
MKSKLAFALSGGGARGALQVGALRALLEAGYHPDILTGTSIGSLNTAFLAIHGINLASIDRLTEAWHDAAQADLLPSNYLWLTVRSLFHRPVDHSIHRLETFFRAHGITPELKYSDIQGVTLLSIAADLNSGTTFVYGLDPSHSVLEGVLASTALPPWIEPIEREGAWLMDGGAVSPLPIEPALNAGATRIIAMALSDPRAVPVISHGFGPFFNKLLYTTEKRQMDTELALAEARGIPVHYIDLMGDEPVPLWDFTKTDILITRGYEITTREIARWQKEQPPAWLGWLPAKFHRYLRKR